MIFKDAEVLLRVVSNPSIQSLPLVERYYTGSSAVQITASLILYDLMAKIAKKSGIKTPFLGYRSHSINAIRYVEQLEELGKDILRDRARVINQLTTEKEVLISK